MYICYRTITSGWGLSSGYEVFHMDYFYLENILMDYHEQLRPQYEFSVNVNSYQNPRAKSATFPIVLINTATAIVHDWGERNSRP